MREHQVNKLDNFIGGWYQNDTSICDMLMEFHSQHPQKRGEIMSCKGEQKVDESVKKSIDVVVPWGSLSDIFVTDYLQPVVEEYIKKYEYCNKYAAWKITEPYQVQKYDPGGGFYQWHCERTSSHQFHNTCRHLVFMMYLNDVDDGGETEFYYQKLKVKPEKGLTLIWPTDWTHTHRGITSPTQTKYVVTGWFNYYPHEGE